MTRLVMVGTRREAKVRDYRRHAHGRQQSAAERQAVYDFVTTRDVYCRAAHIMATLAPLSELAGGLISRHIGLCHGRTERHHAFTGVGAKRITDARHVVLLCAWHHRTWAPSHTGLILDWLAALPDMAERARHEFEEDARDRTEQTPSYRGAMVDAGRGELLR